MPVPPGRAPLEAPCGLGTDQRSRTSYCTGSRMTPPSAALAPTDQAPARPGGPFFVLDREAFLPQFNTRACFVHHRLVDHPLLTLPRLLELAHWLPRKYVRINSG